MNRLYQLSMVALVLTAMLAAGPVLATFQEVEVSGNTSYPIPTQTIGDVDGDGNADIIAFLYDASSTNDELVWYDQGNTWSETSISFAYDNVSQITDGELDNDSNTFDIVIADQATNTIVYGAYDRTLTTWSFTTLVAIHDPVGVMIIDLDEDGDEDVVYSYDNDIGNGGWGWLDNDGSASFTNNSEDNSRDYAFFDIANVDNSPGFDVVLAAPDDGDVYVFTNDGSESFSSSSLGMSVTDPVAVVTADFDTDDPTYGYFVATDAGEAIYKHDNGTTTLVANKTPGTNGVKYIEEGDIDEDGDIDVVAAWPDEESIYWYENEGGFSFTERSVESTNGFDYWWVALDDVDGDGTTDISCSVYGNGSGALSNPQLYYFPSTAVVTNTLSAYDWHLIGIPTTIVPTADGIPTKLFADDIDEAYGAPNWVMSRWVQSLNDYVRFTATGQSGGNPPLISPGYGYWFIHTDGTAPTGENRTLDILHENKTTGEVVLTAAMPDYEDAESRNGFGMFANPYDQSYDVNDMSFGPSDVGWATAITNFNLNSNIATWNGNTYVYTPYDDPATLNPWEGFWLIRTDGTDNTDIDVTFGVPGAGPRGGQLANTREVVHEKLTIEVASLDGEFIDPSNRLGVRSNSQDVYDPFDAFDLGSMYNSYVRFFFPHEDWDTPGKFAFDYRQSRWEEKPVWEAAMDLVNVPNTTFEMTFPDADELPEGVDVLVLETHGDHARPTVLGTARTMEAFTFTTGPASFEQKHFRFEVILGDRNLNAGETLAGSLPTEFGISEVTPNPFNSTTTVSFALPVAADVTVAVYNTLGQQVATLASGRHAAGTHAVAWRADELASGVYLLRAESAGVTETRKLTLVK